MSSDAFRVSNETESKTPRTSARETSSKIMLSGIWRADMLPDTLVHVCGEPVNVVGHTFRRVGSGSMSTNEANRLAPKDLLDHF
jgi:hypothetical protein